MIILELGAGNKLYAVSAMLKKHLHFPICCESWNAADSCVLLAGVLWLFLFVPSSGESLLQNMPGILLWPLYFKINQGSLWLLNSLLTFQQRIYRSSLSEKNNITSVYIYTLCVLLQSGASEYKIYFCLMLCNCNITSIDRIILAKAVILN